MKSRKLTTLVCLTVAIAPAAGCSFLKARSDPTRFYVLTSQGEKRRTAPSSMTVGIDRIELPEYLIRPELVTRSASNQLTIAEFDRWGEPIKDGFTRTFRQDLEHELGAGRVLAAPFDPASRPSFSVDVEVRRFERVGNEGTLLEANWTIHNGTGTATLAARDSRIHTPLSGSDSSATVAALSTSVAILAEEVAAALRDQSGVH
ncbi:MAG: putative lipoprotein [bacterium]|nr:putative lipoprotein [bacterium]